jgi:site-specific DNA recombinase
VNHKSPLHFYLHIEKELKELAGQRNKLHDLLERGVYDIDTFLERSKNLVERIENTQTAIELTFNLLRVENEKHNRKNTIGPAIKDLLERYDEITDIKEKNYLIKSVVDKAEYSKSHDQRECDFDLYLFPKLTKNF